MKIVKESKHFSPINIVLESQDEVDWIYELTRNIAGDGKVREFFDSIRLYLTDETTYHSDEYHDVFQRGSITAK